MSAMSLRTSASTAIGGTRLPYGAWTQFDSTITNMRDSGSIQIDVPV